MQAARLPACSSSMRCHSSAVTVARRLSVRASALPEGGHGGQGAQASGLGRYIKKKQLDPLDTYVPLVLEAQEQLLALKGTVADDAAGARESLRSGAFSGVRDNVRAVGEYAQQAGAKDASGLVNGFFRKLEAFDLVLYRAVKADERPDEADAEAKLQESVEALAALIATVPTDVLERSRRVLEKVKGTGGGAGAGEGAAPAGPQPQTEDVELLQELLNV